MWDVDDWHWPIFRFSINSHIKPIYLSASWSGPVGRGTASIGRKPHLLPNGCLAVGQETVVKTTYCSVSLLMVWWAATKTIQGVVYHSHMNMLAVHLSLNPYTLLLFLSKTHIHTNTRTHTSQHSTWQWLVFDWYPIDCSPLYFFHSHKGYCHCTHTHTQRK